MKTPHPLLLDWNAGEVASELDLRRIEKHFGVALPAWYKRFIMETGSGEGFTEESCVIFYPASSLLEANSGQGRGLDMMDYGLFIFGGDGGGEAYTFNVRRQPCDIVMLAFISNYREDGWILGCELEDLLGYSSQRDYPSFKPEYVTEKDDDWQS